MNTTAAAQGELDWERRARGPNRGKVVFTELDASGKPYIEKFALISVNKAKTVHNIAL